LAATAAASHESAPRKFRSPALTSEELGSLLDLSSRINDLLDLNEILVQVAASARALIETDMSTVLILDQERDQLAVAACDGVDPEVAVRLSTRMGDNLAGRVAESGKPMRCADVPGDSRSRLSVVEDAGIRSAMLAPLEHHGEVIGVLSVQSLERRKFSHREQTVLQLLANQAATAIEKARLYALELGHVDELRAMVARINSQNSIMRRSHDAHERLTQVALEGQGTEALVGTAADLVGTSLVLVNKFGCLADSSSCGKDDQVDKLWSGVHDSEAFEGQIARLRRSAGSAQPEFVAEAGFWRIFPAVAAGEVLGFVIALDRESLEPADVDVLEQAANLVAAELLRERSVAEAEARLHGDLLQSLLADGVPRAELQERAALLGHDLAADQCVVVIRPAGDVPPLDPALASSAGTWASASGGLRAVVGSVDGELACLLREGDRSLGRETVDAWIEAFDGRVAALGATADLRFGVSPIVDGGEQIPEAYRTASQALSVGQLSGGSTVTRFDEVELIATLVSAADEGLLRRFVDRCIGEIEAYDEKRGSALAETLEVYLDRSRVARHASKALFLHPHSLRYRLRRIDEIQGVDLDDPNERLMTHLALKLRSFV
jgi:sugar diacid utilization regulator/putative methionine-R-sulfoxide reductase with GAF domain